MKYSIKVSFIRFFSCGSYLWLHCIYIYLFLMNPFHLFLDALCWVFVAVRELFIQLWCTGFSVPWAPLLQGVQGRAQELRRGACSLSAQTRDRTYDPRIGRQIPNHWTTTEVPACIFIGQSSGRGTSHFCAFCA